MRLATTCPVVIFLLVQGTAIAQTDSTVLRAHSQTLVTNLTQRQTRPANASSSNRLSAGILANAVTANGGVDRANANLQEVTLSPATVSPAAFGKVATFPVDGQVYSQPLYVSGLAIPGKGT